MRTVAAGCGRCGVAHCRHGATQHGATAFVLLILAGLVMAGGATITATTTTPPAAAGVTWSAAALKEIPESYRHLYASAARTCPALSPFLLAGIGKVESDHGQARAPGVRAGLNRAGCCAGPMQFNLTNGPGNKPSTWEAFARPGDSPYDPADAIPAAARKLCANGLEPNASNRRYRGVEDPCPSVRGTPASHRALRRYNNACWYVAEVIAHGLRYAHQGRGVT